MRIRNSLKSQSLLLFFPIVLGLGSPGAAFADVDPSTFLKNRKAIQEIEEKKLATAQEKILSALANQPFEPRLHLNLGLTFEMMEQPEKAQASYEQALKLADDDQTRFAANYNLGQLMQRAKKTDEALRYYQEALRFEPESKETKINIELLIQQNQGKGEGQDQQQQQDQNGQGQGQNQNPNQDQQDQKEQNKENEQKDKPKDQPQQPKQGKPQPKQFKSEELTQGDAKKILGEIKQQEQKIRAEFNRKEVKEKPLEKDW